MAYQSWPFYKDKAATKYEVAQPEGVKSGSEIMGVPQLQQRWRFP